jgi:hypothetical protein
VPAEDQRRRLLFQKSSMTTALLMLQTQGPQFHSVMFEKHLVLRHGGAVIA